MNKIDLIIITVTIVWWILIAICTALKLVGLINWSWLWTLVPFWGPLVLLSSILCVGILSYCIVKLFHAFYFTVKGDS